MHFVEDRKPYKLTSTFISQIYRHKYRSKMKFLNNFIRVRKSDRKGLNLNTMSTKTDLGSILMVIVMALKVRRKKHQHIEN